VPLGNLTEGGVELDAKVSAPLVESIFWPSNPLHDLAAVIRGDRVLGAGIQLPMAEEGAVPPHLGARHRAGLGITLETDSVVLIVSEETGSIRLASRGKLSPPIPRDQVRERLLAAFAAVDEDSGEPDAGDGREAGRRAAAAERGGAA
jgi:diadenylate cyclase